MVWMQYLALYLLCVLAQKKLLFLSQLFNFQTPDFLNM
jgi:hypothetical protein